MTSAAIAKVNSQLDLSFMMIRIASTFAGESEKRQPNANPEFRLLSTQTLAINQTRDS